MEKLINKIVPVLIASLAVYVWLDGYYALATLCVGVLLTVFHTFLVSVVFGGVLLAIYPFVKPFFTDSQSVAYMNIAFVSFALGIVCESIRMFPRLTPITEEQVKQVRNEHVKTHRSVRMSSLYRYAWYTIGIIAIAAGIISNIMMK